MYNNQNYKYACMYVLLVYEKTVCVCVWLLRLNYACVKVDVSFVLPQ